MCIRPATYESEIEAEILKRYFRARSGELENTVFALLDPEGKRLSRGGRSPRMVFEDAPDMAREMERIAERFDARKTARQLPTIDSVRLGLNVAACDSMPLVVALAPKPERLRKKLAELAWTKELVGRTHYAFAASDEELEKITGRKEGDVFVIAPDDYGLEGKAIASLSSKKKSLAADLRKALDAFEPPVKDDRRHVRQGRRQGIDWESEIPVTDPQERRKRR